MTTGMQKSLRHRIEEARSHPTDAEALELTVQRLIADGEISASRAEAIRAVLPSQLSSSRYILKHLGAHGAIGVIFAFDLIPLPLGTIARVVWVAGSRLVESVRRNRSRAEIHSLAVFLIAAIPWLGYAAYLLPLRRQGSELTFILANHTWLNRTGRTYEQFLAHRRSPIRRIGRWLVPRPGRDEHAA